jgi:hypothetical protein
MRIRRINRYWQIALNWIAIPLFSLVLLIPCFWQSRIQAADLSSHIYNAWLAHQIHQGKAPGLWISFQSTNVLFDLMLEWLLVRVRPDLAQRVAVSVSVLAFGWGAIVFIFRVAGRNWWLAGPCVAMLSYGFIFHMGFCNFYLSMALCLWYLAISWGQGWRVHAIASFLLVVAWIAHPFPVVWAAGTAAYVALATRIEPRRRALPLLAGLAALVVARVILTHRYAYSWSYNQATLITGANQVGLFGLRYALPMAALLAVWLLLLRKLFKDMGMANLFLMIPFQLWLLNAAAVLLIPDRVMFPQFGHPLGFIAERFSLTAGLWMCALLAGASTTRLSRVALVSAAVCFLGLLYADDRKLNSMEDQLDAAVGTLPQGQRVVSLLPDPSLYSLCLYHDLDRACIGHCLSYANYEASSRQFRIRAGRGNGIVLDNFADVAAAASGTYVVQSLDLPIHLVYRCGPGLTQICSRPMQMGETLAKGIETAQAPVRSHLPLSFTSVLSSFRGCRAESNRSLMITCFLRAE